MAKTITNEEASLDQLFEEVPVGLDEFIYSEEFLGLEKLSEKQYDFISHGTQVYEHSTLKKLGWEPLRSVSELVCQWGKGSGKDHCSCIILSRIAYLLLCLHDPQLYYGKSRVSYIDMINMAFSAPQAKSNFFQPFSEIIRSSPWFLGKAKIGTDLIGFDKRIRAFSGHSFGGAIEGKNLICAVLDEIAEFKTQKEFELSGRKALRMPKYSAEGLYDVIRSSIDSRFPLGKLILISYPRFKGDFIQQKYNENLSDENGYSSFGCTWDINPTMKKENFETEFRRSPERAAAKYECNPSQREDSFFKRPKLIEKALPDIEEKDCPTTDDLFPTLKEWFRCKHNYLCAMHVDLAKNFCRAGLAVAHQSDIKIVHVVDEATNDLVSMEVPIITMDLLTSFEAVPGGEIDLSQIRTFIKEVRRRGFKINTISFDGFESLDMTQQLSAAGFNVIYRSLDRNRQAYDDLKALIYDERFVGGYSAPRTVTVGGKVTIQRIAKEELKSLVDVGGKKVDHVSGASKDEADALAGAVEGAIEIGLWKSGDDKDALTNERIDRKFGTVNPEIKKRYIPTPYEDLDRTVPESVLYRGNP